MIVTTVVAKVEPLFSPGQLIFAGLFFAGFVFLMIFSYRKDRELHKRQYRGVAVILILFVIFILGLFALKYYLQP